MFYYLWNMLGYEDEEVKADEKQLKQRNLLHKQLRHTNKFILKAVNDKEVPVDMTASSYLEPAIPVGRIYTKPPTNWSKIVEGKKKQK